MNKIISLLVTVTSMIAMATPAMAQDHLMVEGAHYAMSQVEPIYMRAEGYEYDHEVLIALPATYDAQPDKEYPVLWAMDGALLCTRAVYPSMRERGGGAIVNQSSTAAWMGVGFYGLAKLGINGITQATARELGHMGIRVNAIAPGPTDTPALEKTAGAAADAIVAQLPLSRIGKPVDHVDTLLFLLSDGASWITGQVVNVDGGQIMRP